MNAEIELKQRGLSEAQAQEVRQQVSRWLDTLGVPVSRHPSLRVAIERRKSILQGCPYRVDVELETSSSALRVTRSPARNDAKTTVGYAVRQALGHLERALRPMLRPALRPLRRRPSF